MSVVARRATVDRADCADSQGRRDADCPDHADKESSALADPGSVINFVWGHTLRRSDARTRTPTPTDIPETILDQFGGPARPMSPVEVDAITKRLKEALVERMLGGGLTHHLGYPPGGEKPLDGTNHRNGQCENGAHR